MSNMKMIDENPGYIMTDFETWIDHIYPGERIFGMEEIDYLIQCFERAQGVVIRDQLLLLSQPLHRRVET